MIAKSGEAHGSARVVVADEQPFLRQGFEDYIEKQPDLAICGEADSVPSAIAVVESQLPDLLVADLRLGGGDVLEMVKSLRSRFPSLRILILSQQEELIYAERVLRAGANGYVMKQERPDEVLNAMRRVLAGEIYVSRKLAFALLSKMLQSGPVSESRSLNGLSDREFQVYEMIGAGMGSRMIAVKLSLSVKTIETYRENIKHKFNLRNSAELVQHATAWLQEGRGGRARVEPGRLPLAAMTSRPGNSPAATLRASP